jgi:hypothetical protein
MKEITVFVAQVREAMGLLWSKQIARTNFSKTKNTSRLR